MSDNWITVIPKEPKFVPTEGEIETAKLLFQSFLPEADEIRIHRTQEIRFYDCGANFERVCCPACNREIDIEWWHDEMGDDWDRGFSLSEIELPCCKAKSDLNSLVYEWDQGFARFAFDAMNPNIPELKGEQIEALEEVLKCRLKQILQHL